ncbi:unnamed protein product [Auanema sp. JU1783]|nr:unnamed protein product [Auanema sp. JU1783]
MADLCLGFEPQNYLKDRCRRCFRHKDKHDDVILNVQQVQQQKKERRKSWKDRIADNGAPDEVSVSDDAEVLSVSSYLSATSKGFSSIKSQESINDTKSMVTAISGSICEEERAMTPTEDDQSVLLGLKEEVTRLREENRQLKDHREEVAKRRAYRPKDESEQSLVQMLEDRLNEAENSIQDYRDENTVLKCELRELQETTYSNSDQKLKEKIQTTESLCDELMEENEVLKAEVKDLQHEIEEMQDQYREEEIEEFRELQRELEQNAKNCRVLQFKLRKAERQKEQIETEKMQAETKLKDLKGTSGENGVIPAPTEATKIKELESELRIAKEVSVRLHNELEQTEEKRYKLEDEVFYLKEKVRELQTQSKWREARNRTDNAVKRLSAELSTSITLPDGDMSKELRDALEREIDIREQLRYAEEDLKRTQSRLQEMEAENESLLKKLSKSAKLRPPMVRSASEGNAHLQLELAEHEVEHLTSKVERLEKTNDHLTKKILELETDYTKRIEEGVRLCGGELSAEVKQDMSKMLATISDLERRNLELSHQLRNQESKTQASSNNTASSSELRTEQEKRRATEIELHEIKQTMLKTDNQKLISLATKIEQLNNQLSMANDRCNTLHKKLAKEGDSAKYMDELKLKVENLEKQLSEKKAYNTIQELQGKVPTSDEIEQVCEVLGSIELQTVRISKQVEKMDLSQKDDRRRSLSKDSGATIIAELAHMMEELKNVHKVMDTIKSSDPTVLMRRSPLREMLNTPVPIECKKCKENDKFVEEQQNEIIFYKKKNKDLTNQVLQTEDRWTIEIEKQRQIFENEIKSLNLRLTDNKRQLEELEQLLQSRSSALLEKSKGLEETEERLNRLQKEFDDQKKDIQDMDSNKKAVKEFEIKYKKLESIFDAEREKMNSERSRNKNEVVALKKIADDAEDLLKSTTEDLRKKDFSWKSDRAALEREIVSLKKQLAASKNGEGSEHDELEKSNDSDKADSTKLSRHESDRVHIIDLKKQIALLEKKNSDSEAKLEEVKISNAELRDELNRIKQSWQKDKDSFQHKTRQTEKIRSVEMDAVQQKFSSRMRIMEDTNKSLHSQLVLARRERDNHKESLTKMEKKNTDEKKTFDIKSKELVESSEKLKQQGTKICDLESEMERIKTDLRLTKEARKADQILWNMDRERARTDKNTEEEKKQMQSVQQHYKECEKFYTNEMDRLNDRIKEITASANQQKLETGKTMNELRETIRMLEIDQRNLCQNKDTQSAAREMLESEAERLQQIVHMTELQKLTRKYRLSSIIDQLQYVTDPLRRSGNLDHPDGMRYIISQLTAIRDEDTQSVNPEDRCSSVQPSLAEQRNGYAPSISECGEGTYDNISQSSFSIRSVTSMPVRSTVRWSSNQASVVSSTIASPPTQSKTSHATSAQSSRVQLTSPVDRLNVDAANLTFNCNGSLETSPKYQGIAEGPFPLQHTTSTPNVPNHPASKRSFSTESTTGYDRYGRPLSQRKIVYQEPQSFLNRTASFDRRSELDEEEPNHSRCGSTGTNILYRIRREELARGGQPSVKLMAKAFEAIDDTKSEKKGFFGIRKSRSVEATQDRGKKKDTLRTQYSSCQSPEQEPIINAYGTLPRGGRNPFKHMGSKLVERVRRSLSRSSRQEKEKELLDDYEKQTRAESPKKEKILSSPKKTKKKSAESKAKKAAAGV